MTASLFSLSSGPWIIATLCTLSRESTWVRRSRKPRRAITASFVTIQPWRLQSRVAVSAIQGSRTKGRARPHQESTVQNRAASPTE